MAIKTSWLALGGMILLAGCQNTDGTGRVNDRTPNRSFENRPGISLKDVPIVTQEKTVKVGIFWRSHSPDLENRNKITYAYWVLTSTSWARQKGTQINDPFATLGFPIYHTMGDEAITDEAMNRFLNFMISQKLNEFPTRPSVDPMMFQDDSKNIVAMYVETPQTRKIIFRDDMNKNPELHTAFKTIYLYFVKLCNEAHVTYVGASVDEEHDRQKPVPPR